MFPEYWAKRKHVMDPEFIKKVEETAKREPEVTDDYGSYKPGTFLYRSAIVTVTHDDGLWNLHIFSKNPITDLMVKEVREEFLPDAALMARLYGSRENADKVQGVILYEIPTEE